MRPFLIANMVNLAIRLSVALICAPRFGIAFVWLGVPAGWLANFLISYAALRKLWPIDKVDSIWYIIWQNSRWSNTITWLLYVLLVFPTNHKKNSTVRILKTSKTESSVRKIFLPKSVANMLVDWKAEQDEMKEECIICKAPLIYLEKDEWWSVCYAIKRN